MGMPWNQIMLNIILNEEKLPSATFHELQISHLQMPSGWFFKPVTKANQLSTGWSGTRPSSEVTDDSFSFLHTCINLF